MEEKERKLSGMLKAQFSPEDYINKLFTLKNVAQLFHWEVSGTGSFAAHKASETLYEELVPAIDEFVESYQGKYGLMKLTVDKSVSNQNFVAYLKSTAVYNEEAQSKFKESWLQNQVDEISKLLYQTLYKLENLK